MAQVNEVTEPSMHMQSLQSHERAAAGRGMSRIRAQRMFLLVLMASVPVTSSAALRAASVGRFGGSVVVPKQDQGGHFLPDPWNRGLRFLQTAAVQLRHGDPVDKFNDAFEAAEAEPEE